MGRSQNLTGITTGQQNVTTSGTPVQLSDVDIPAGVLVTIKAKSANTGRITLGSSSANALNTGTSFFSLGSNDATVLQVDNLNRIWIDATVSGEGIEYLFER